MVIDSLVTPYLLSTYSIPGLAAEAAAIRKRSQYAAIMLTHILIAVAVETFEPINTDGLFSRSNW